MNFQFVCALASVTIFNQGHANAETTDAESFAWKLQEAIKGPAQSRRPPRLSPRQSQPPRRPARHFSDQDVESFAEMLREAVHGPAQSSALTAAMETIDAESFANMLHEALNEPAQDFEHEHGMKNSLNWEEVESFAHQLQEALHGPAQDFDHEHGVKNRFNWEEVESFADLLQEALHGPAQNFLHEDRLEKQPLIPRPASGAQSKSRFPHSSSFMRRAAASGAMKEMDSETLANVFQEDTPSMPMQASVHSKRSAVPESSTFATWARHLVFFLGLLLCWAVLLSWAREGLLKVKVGSQMRRKGLDVDDMNLVRLAAAASVRQRCATSVSQDIV